MRGQKAGSFCFFFHLRFCTSAPCCGICRHPPLRSLVWLRSWHKFPFVIHFLVSLLFCFVLLSSLSHSFLLLSLGLRCSSSICRR
uniref:Uncharacterized protein n=1 Tax=Trypanosoma congolense (strain IL3000) TaxID=1068625 RepID=G0URA9_TRYCI|nr:hypothetical protein, unlikely [Trypanosoma congolense IL3000]